MYACKCRAIEAYDPCGAIEGDSILYIVLAGESYYGTPFDKLSKMPLPNVEQRGKIGKLPAQGCLFVALLGEKAPQLYIRG